MNRAVLGWASWDCGSAAWNAVITTFVFTVYLTSSSFGTPEDTSAVLGLGLTIAAFLIAVLAPITGRRSDQAERDGHGMRWLAIYSVAVFVAAALLVFIRPTPAMLWPGVILLALGTIAFEFASINYNAMLTRISTPATIGRISGLGWGAGYLGGIVLLLVLLIGFIQPDVGWFGVTHQDGMHVRASMLVSALWFGLFAIPLFRWVPKARAAAHAARVTPASGATAARGGLIASYRQLWQSLRELRRDHPHTVYFLIASAVFRDGLVGVFTFGGVIAAGTFGFSPGTVILFGVAANVGAGIATILGGLLDDVLGPKRIIIGSLVLMSLTGLGIFFGHNAGAGLFWVLGLILALFVGPAQSASRSLLARILPAGREGEIFGLYATTGRAVSFLAPLMFSASIALGRAVLPPGQDAQYWGILGIIAVLIAGLVMVLPIHSPPGQAGATGATRA